MKKMLTQQRYDLLDALALKAIHHQSNVLD